jgi:KaiC/GvpD/RAD55 family RecA-like ATPase
MYIELIGELLKNNKDILSIEFVQNGLKGLIEESPILAKLTVNDDFQLESNLPDFKGSLEALKSFLEFLYNYIGKLIPPEDVKGRFVLIGENYIQDHSTEVLSSDMLRWFPTFFFQDKGNKDPLDISSLRSEPENKQVIIIFESIFTVYLQEAFKLDDRNLFFNEVMEIKKNFPILNQFLITKTGDVTINFEEESVAEQLVKELSEVFNYFVDFSAYNLGSDMAIKRAKESIKPILDLLEDLPENLGVVKYLLNGALASRIPTGIPGFDGMIQGGIPRGKSILIQAPQGGSEKNFFISHFIKNGLENNANMIITLGKHSPKIFKIQLKTLGTDTGKYEKDERLKIIDWFSWRKGEAKSDEEDSSIITSGQEFSELWRSIEVSLNKLKYSPAKCAVLDFISPGLESYEFEQVHAFVTKLLQKFEEHEITALFLIEKETHDASMLANLRMLFNGVIDIEHEEVEGRSNSRIRVLFMHDTEYDPEFKILSLKGTKLRVN